MPIGKEEAIRLTVARYYLPSGRTIQSKGVDPDIEVFPGEVKVVKDEFSIKERDLKKHLTTELEKLENKKKKKKEAEDKKKSKKIISKDDLLKDNQLKTATDTLKVLKITEETPKGNH